MAGGHAGPGDGEGELDRVRLSKADFEFRETRSRGDDRVRWKHMLIDTGEGRVSASFVISGLCEIKQPQVSN